MTKSPAQQTMKTKSMLMTQFLLDFEKLTKQRVTSALIRSPEWKQARDAYVQIFLDLMKGQTK